MIWILSLEMAMVVIHELSTTPVPIAI